MEAKELFKTIININPRDLVAEKYLERCDGLLATGWDDTWQSVVHLDSK